MFGRWAKSEQAPNPPSTTPPTPSTPATTTTLVISTPNENICPITSIDYNSIIPLPSNNTDNNYNAHNNHHSINDNHSPALQQSTQHIIANHSQLSPQQQHSASSNHYNNPPHTEHYPHHQQTHPHLLANGTMSSDLTNSTTTISTTTLTPFSSLDTNTEILSPSYFESAKDGILNSLTPLWDQFYDFATNTTLSELFSNTITLTPQSISILAATGAIASLIISRFLYDSHQSNLRSHAIDNCRHLIFYSYHTERLNIAILLAKIHPTVSVPTVVILHQSFASLVEVPDIGTLSYCIAKYQLFENIFPQQRLQQLTNNNIASTIQNNNNNTGSNNNNNTKSQPAITESTPHKIFHLFDTSKDQQLDFYEYLSGIMLLFYTPSLFDLFTTAYSRFDSNGSNALTVDQACDVLEALNPYGHLEMSQYLRLSSSTRPTIDKKTFANISVQWCDDWGQDKANVTNLLNNNNLSQSTGANFNTLLNNHINSSATMTSTTQVNFGPLWNYEFLSDFASLIGLVYDPFNRILIPLDDFEYTIMNAMAGAGAQGHHSQYNQQAADSRGSGNGSGLGASFSMGQSRHHHPQQQQSTSAQQYQQQQQHAQQFQQQHLQHQPSQQQLNQGYLNANSSVGLGRPPLSAPQQQLQLQQLQMQQHQQMMHQQQIMQQQQYQQQQQIMQQQQPQRQYNHPQQQQQQQQQQSSRQSIHNNKNHHYDDDDHYDESYANDNFQQQQQQRQPSSSHRRSTINQQ